jgi:hypothetical protein
MVPIWKRWPSPEDLAMCRAVEDTLRAANVGILTAVGARMRKMYLCYRVEDESAAGAVIAQAMSKVVPRIRVIYGPQLACEPCPH